MESTEQFLDESPSNVEHLHDELKSQFKNYDGPEPAGYLIRGLARLIDTVFGYGLTVIAFFLLFHIWRYPNQAGTSTIGLRT